MTWQQPTHWSGKQCNSRGQIWTRRIHLQGETRVRPPFSPATLFYGTADDLTVECVRLHQDPHTVDGHHRICSQVTSIISRIVITEHCGRCSWWHLHIAYWKAFDFTSRLMPFGRKKREAALMRKWECHCQIDSLKRRETPQLAFKNEKGGVRKFVKPMLSAAPGLRQTNTNLYDAVTEKV